VMCCSNWAVKSQCVAALEMTSCQLLITTRITAPTSALCCSTSSDFCHLHNSLSLSKVSSRYHCLLSRV